MPNQISKDKQRVSLVLTRDLVRRLDVRAAEDGRTRTDVITNACESYLAPEQESEKAATKADLAALAAKLDALEAQNRASASAIAKAVREQPIAVQALPEPKPKKGKKRKKKR